MTLVDPDRSTTAASSGMALAGRVLRVLDRIPYWLIAVPLRVAVADVFWSSALTHAANWQTTLYMFENDYKVPLLSPTLAAYLAVTIEFATPPLLVLGLATRLASLILLGMITVIEVFIYPLAWPTHIQWAAMLFVLLAQGPGGLSLDALIRHYALARDRNRPDQLDRSTRLHNGHHKVADISVKSDGPQ